MAKNRIITVQDIPITVSEMDTDDYICITDMATAKSDNSRAADVIKNWLRNTNISGKFSGNIPIKNAFSRLSMKQSKKRAVNLPITIPVPIKFPWNTQRICTIISW